MYVYTIQKNGSSAQKNKIEDYLLRPDGPGNIGLESACISASFPTLASSPSRSNGRSIGVWGDFGASVDRCSETLAPMAAPPASDRVGSETENDLHPPASDPGNLLV